MADDIWARIAKLRVKDMGLLAPVVKDAVESGIKLCAADSIVVRPRPGVEETIELEALVVETLRVQELQEIYFSQKTSKQRSVLKSMHNYGVAVDVISAEFGWFTDSRSIKRWPNKEERDRVAVQWFKEMSFRLSAGKTMSWGGLWKRFPDSPHFQSARVPDTPNDAMIKAYSTAGGGLSGRMAVWKMYGLDSLPSAPILA